MNELLKEIAKGFPNCALAQAKELELRNDGIHFSSKSENVTDLESAL